MNKKYILSALMCVVAVVFTGCIEENFEKITPAQDGDEIVFGARAGFENSGAETRTIYTGVTYEVEYTVDNKTVKKTFERIDWVDGTDMIEIHSPEAANGSTAHYTINHLKDADQQKDYAYLTRIGDSSLQWNGDGQHNFYAMYPSSRMFTSESTLVQGVKMEGTTLRGTIPALQAPVSIEKNGTNWTATPDMKYAYMAAKGTATREDGSVSLTFVPVVTAVQIQLTLDASSTGSVVKPLEIAEVEVQGVGIAGDFSADLSSWNGAYPTCQNVGTGIDNIMVSLWKDDKPITVNPGDSLTFTVFLRPGQEDYENLHVAISPNGAAYKGKKMELPIPANLKTRISNFRLPVSTEDIVFDASNWMAQIAPETQLMKLSIPGSGGSFSYNYNSSNPSWYKQQTLTFDQQWKAGIRAFEIVSERPAAGTTSLGTEDVKCNRVSMNWTVSQVLDTLLARVAKPAAGSTEPSECAVLILTYQPEGSGRARNGALYAESLYELYNGLSAQKKAQIIQYTPSLTLDQARGNVMVFCRINQKDETDNGDTEDKRAFDHATETLKGTNITLIDGCGTGKDRWGSRGYTVKGTDESGNVIWNVAYDASNINDATKSVDYYLRKSNSGSFADWNNVRKPSGNLNFGYGTNFDDVTCWYQEWARVVPASLIDSSLGYFYVDNQPSIIDWFPTDYRWYESYTEKLAAATTTFNMAISDKYPSYVFINSLCGYFVDRSIESSYTVFTGSNTGGIAGNIEALANEINPDFYAHVLEAASEQTTGPTGIVMMDYVKNSASGDNDGGYYLPGVIIANNRKFGTGNSSSSGSNGGGNTDTDNPGSDDEGGEEGM